MPELKTAVLMIRIKPSLKRKAERRAAAEDRSVASYIERLIEQDAKRGWALPHQRVKLTCVSTVPSARRVSFSFLSRASAGLILEIDVRKRLARLTRNGLLVSRSNPSPSELKDGRQLLPVPARIWRQRIVGTHLFLHTRRDALDCGQWIEPSRR
jgi:hypothetical protein